METQKQRKIPGHNQCSIEEILATDSLAADWTESEVLAFITACFDRDVLLKTLLGYASSWLSTRMIAVVTRSELQPFLLEGWSENSEHQSDLQHLRTLRAPLPAILENPANKNPANKNTEGAQPDENLLTIAPIETTGLQPLFDLLALPPPYLLAVQPVQVAGKTVLLLIGAPKNPADGDDHPAREISSLSAAAHAVGEQLGEVIGRAKAGTLPPVEERIPELPHPLSTRRMSALVVEELTSSLLTQSESVSNPIDSGWLDLLEDPSPAAPPEHLQEKLLDDQSSIPAPLLRGQENRADKPSHTLEMFPDALLDPGAPGKTVTHGFENLGQDLSESESIQQTNAEHVEHARPAHTLELFVLDAHLRERDTDPLTNTNTNTNTNRTISGGFEAIRRDSEPQLTNTNKTLSGGFEAIRRDSESEQESVEQPTKSSVPDAGILRRKTITPKSFETLNRAEQEAAKNQVPASDNPPLINEPESPVFDIESYQKAFPGQLVIDRYQHTAQTMPPAHEHSPLLAELAKIGPPALEVIRMFINSSSLELRFYAVLLLEEMPVHNMLEDIVERLFDRDQQIRALAQRIVLNARLDTNFERVVVQRLRNEIISNYEELRVEVAAEIIGALQDALSIPLLIEALGEHRSRVQLILQQTLMRLTFQDFAPSISEWRHWWQKAQHEPRTTWLVDALDSPNEAIRHAAFKQTQQIPGLNLNYHPDQPQKLRERAQQQLTQWFENF